MELLAPAGSLEKLKVAVLYGAQAVYLSGQEYGLRAAAENFSWEELALGVAFAHQSGVKVYVVLNGFLHDGDLEQLPLFVQFLDSLAVDGVIVADLGVITLVQAHSNLPIHLSTQASCLSAASARVWQDLGVERIVLGREVTLASARKIKEQVAIELEMFIHGSMCMAYSGNCIISNYTQGRDSNRGGCAHSCRFEYSVQLADGTAKNAFFMSSKDLCGIEVLGQYLEAGIDCVKVEGRMKGPLYLATTTKVYAQALAQWQTSPPSSEQVRYWQEELEKISHRQYSTGSLLAPADHSSIYHQREHETPLYSLAAKVVEVWREEALVVAVKSAFAPGDYVELVRAQGENYRCQLAWVQDLYSGPILRTNPGMLVKIPYISGALSREILRVRLCD